MTDAKNVINNKPSKGRAILFWIATGLLSFELLFGALWDFNLVEKGYVYLVLQHLGYPLYLATLLGTCKILAGVTILLPRFNLVKEWAYAGIVILFSGALFSHLSMGDGPDKYGMAVIFLIIAVMSWFAKPRQSVNRGPDHLPPNQ